jgi:PII-like signaling protein
VWARIQLLWIVITESDRIRRVEQKEVGMMTGSRFKCLRVVVEDTDSWNGERLYEAIVRLLHRNHVAGATVWSGVMGYGAHGRIHRKGLFGVSDEKPVVIEAVDSEEKIRAVLPQLLPMIKEGLVLLQDAEVFVRGQDT